MRANLRRAHIIEASSGALVATAEIADTATTRMVGLLGRARLEAGTAMLIMPCDLIHTWFMRFAIDVLFIGHDGEVVRTYDALPPFRLAWGSRRACRTIELPAGARRKANLRVGSILRIEAT